MERSTVSRIKIEVQSPKADDLVRQHRDRLKDAILSSAPWGTLGIVRVTLERVQIPGGAESA